ncbi:MAG: hypothetical protein CMH62_00420 [Nanoarchaeota archaeon]|nr:hypothetical protein [Nanoarchaeota archaeon]
MYEEFKNGGEKMRLFGIIFLFIFVLILNVSAADFDLTKQDSGIVSGLEGELLKLSVDGRNELDMTINRVGVERVMITLDGNILVLDIGQSKNLDLDKDGVNEVKLELNNVIDKLASFKFEGLNVVENEVMEKEDEIMEDEDDHEHGVDDVHEEETSDTNVVTGGAIGLGSIGNIAGISNWVLGIVAIIVIIILIFIFKGDGGSSEKNYNKAMELHREGQEFHWDGDDETAEELYDKADELREKARNLEGGF